jgi:hypothetical protein
MKTKQITSVLAFTLVTAAILAVHSQLFAETTNDFSVERLVSLSIPSCRLQMDDLGKPHAIVSAAGEVLNLTTAAQETPAPTNSVIGYWFSSSMNFLSRQNIKVTTHEQAEATIQLLHAIWRSPDFVKQKIYHAHPIDVGWLVEVEHDFTNYPGNVRVIHPYELLVDGGHNVVQLRERCYSYPGSALVYTNTVISVYEREIKLDGGRNYPEELFKELRNAWARENEQRATKPSQIQKGE